MGQQNIGGKRISFGRRNRTLPHFNQFDYGPVSRGFIHNSYLQGLTPVEFFFHAMAGRESIINKASEIADTGYLQRRLMKALEDISINYDGTVRNAQGEIIQFSYGEDGMDGTQVEHQQLESLSLSKSQFHKVYNWNVDNSNFGNSLMLEELEQLKEDQKELQKQFQSGAERLPLPCNLRRIILNAQKCFQNDHSSLVPSTIIEDVQALICRLPTTHIFNIHLRSLLASKRVLTEFHLSGEAFQWCIKEIEEKICSAVAQPGESVGAIAAQSIGEPTTQMTLNTFHHAGVSSKNTVLGIPRFKELMDMSKNMKSPSSTVFLLPHLAQDTEVLKEVACSLAYITLGQLVSCVSTYFDPDQTSTHIIEDMAMVEEYMKTPNLNIDLDDYSPWLLRLELDKEKMVDSRITKEALSNIITEKWRESEMHYLVADNVIRIRLKLSGHPNVKGVNLHGEPDESFLLKFFYTCLFPLAITGVVGIKKVLYLFSTLSFSFLSSLFFPPLFYS